MPPITRRRNSLRPTRSKPKRKPQRERKQDDFSSNDPPRSRSSRHKRRSRESKSTERKNRPQSGSKEDEKKLIDVEPRTRSQKRKADTGSLNLNISSFPTCIDVPRSNKKARKFTGEASLVTPSPNLPRSITKVSRREDLEDLKNYSYSSTSSFEESLCSESCLPEGVNNIQSSSTSLSDNDHNSPTSLTESFIKCYGKDFYKSFISAENDFIYQPSDRFKASPSISSMSPGVRRRSPRLRKQALSSSPSSISSSSMMSSNESQSYEDHFNYLERKNGIGEKARSILISWIVEVGMEYKLAQITLHTAIGLVDRSLAIATIVDRDHCQGSDDTSGLVLDRSTLQLLGCACMQIASKIHEVSPPTTSDFSFISADTYSRDLIVEMELDVCSALRFHLTIVTPYHFIDYFLRASFVSSDVLNRAGCSGGANKDVMHYMAEYLLELAILDFRFVRKKPSLVAATVIYLARAYLDIRDLTNPNCKGCWSKTLEWYTDYSETDLRESALQLSQICQRTDEDHLKVIYEKYQDKAYKMVSYKTASLDAVNRLIKFE